MKKILITGSNGLLGQKLIDLFAQKKKIKLIGLSLGKNRNHIQNSYKYYDCDLTNYSDFENIINTENPTEIIHTAGMTNVDACELNKKKCDEINVEVVRNIVRICEYKKIFLVHLSTDFIFDGLSSPYNENTKYSPVSYYGLSKAKAEKIILNSNIKSAILRTAIIYGVVNDMNRTNIVLWAKEALEKGEKIKVVNDQYRCPTLVEDLAKLCELVLQKNTTGIFNAVGKDYMCIYEIVERIADFWKLDKSIITETSSSILNQPAKRPYKTELKLDKTIKELEYKPHSFEEGLEIVNQQLK